MATLIEKRAMRDALSAAMATGVMRATFQGRTVEYRSIAEMERVLMLLSAEIARLEGRAPIRVVYSPGAKYL